MESKNLQSNEYQVIFEGNIFIIFLLISSAWTCEFGLLGIQLPWRSSGRIEDEPFGFWTDHPDVRQERSTKGNRLLARANEFGSGKVRAIRIGGTYVYILRKYIKHVIVKRSRYFLESYTVSKSRRNNKIWT